MPPQSPFHAVSLSVDLPPVAAKHLMDVLSIGDPLRPRSYGLQLKYLIVLRVFTLAKLVILLMNSTIHEAFYSMPIVCWCAANQGLNVARGPRLILLEAALDFSRRYTH
jgi:hypothetical protein